MCYVGKKQDKVWVPWKLKIWWGQFGEGGSMKGLLGFGEELDFILTAIGRQLSGVTQQCELPDF